MTVYEQFDLTGRVAVITGGAGLLGVKHAEAIAEMGGVPVLVDIAAERVVTCAEKLGRTFGLHVPGLCVDITEPQQVKQMSQKLLNDFGHIDILINNAANNPKVEAQDNGGHWSRLEQFPLDVWHKDIAIGLTGAFVCSQVIGQQMAQQKNGVILNIASDLSIIAPDQRIYRQPGLADEQQPVKPVTYSVVKAGLVGLTRYLATYWADDGVRVNAISPGGIFNGQDEAFVTRLTKLIPLGRMAHTDEYKAAVVFMVSDASSYMTGANIVIDGGRTVW